MPRPCQKNHEDPQPDTCRLCWLAVNDERYQRIWSEAKDPSLLQKAVNFTAAAIGHVMAGLPVLSDEKTQERLEICRSNQCGNYKDGSCRKCGCNLPLKARWAEQKCPEGLWPVTSPPL